MRYFFLLFILLIFGKVDLAAQNACKCNEIDYVHNINDSIRASRLLQSVSNICRAKGYELMGKYMTGKNNLDSAEIYLQSAEKLFKHSNCGDSILLTTYESWAQVYYTRADFANAQKFSLKMLQSAEAAGNIYKQANANTMIAQLFNQTNQAEKGIVYTRKAVMLIDKINDLSKKNDIIYKISKRYLWHYQDTKTNSSLDSSGLFSRLQIELSRKLNKRGSIANAFNNLQAIAFEKNNLSTALMLLDSSFTYIDKDDYENLRIYYFDKADILSIRKDYTKAAQLLDSALYYGKLLQNKAFIVDSYELLSYIAKEQGDYKKAFEFKQMSNSITDSIRSVEKTEIVAELEKKYTQAKNENIIKDLDKKKQLYLFLAISGLLAVTAIGFFVRQQSLKHKKNILEAEQRLNRARMNPHFFFNALTTLQKFALNENNGQAMASNLSKFSNIMREALESTYKEYVTIEQEMAFLKEYLEVQKIRFPQTFSYEVFAEKELEVDELVIPSMIIQPFIENSIEHGFVGVDYPGNIKIQFASVQKELVIHITDNGKGLKTAAKKNNEHISRASQIIKDRIYLLNIKLKTKAGFSIKNNTSGNGVLVTINLPLLFKGEKNI